MEIVRVLLVVVLAGGWMAIGAWLGWCAGWKAGKKHALKQSNGGNE